MRDSEIHRRHLFGEIYNRWWCKWPLLGWAAIGSWDLLLSQFIPEETAKRFPKAYQVVEMTTGWLSWQSWLLIGAIFAALCSIEFAFRQRRPLQSVAAENPNITINNTFNYLGQPETRLSYAGPQTEQNDTFVVFTPNGRIINAANVSSVVDRGSGEFTFLFGDPLETLPEVIPIGVPASNLVILDASENSTTIRISDFDQSKIGLRFKSAISVAHVLPISNGKSGSASSTNKFEREKKLGLIKEMLKVVPENVIYPDNPEFARYQVSSLKLIKDARRIFEGQPIPRDAKALLSISDAMHHQWYSHRKALDDLRETAQRERYSDIYELTAYNADFIRFGSALSELSADLKHIADAKLEPDAYDHFVNGRVRAIQQAINPLAQWHNAVNENLRKLFEALYND